jgi:hypothetical protein
MILLRFLIPVFVPVFDLTLWHWPSGRYSPLTTLVPEAQEDNVLYSSRLILLLCSNLIHAISLSCLCRIAFPIPAFYATCPLPPTPPAPPFMFIGLQTLHQAHLSYPHAMHSVVHSPSSSASSIHPFYSYNSHPQV